MQIRRKLSPKQHDYSERQLRREEEDALEGFEQSDTESTSDDEEDVDPVTFVVCK